MGYNSHHGTPKGNTFPLSNLSMCESVIARLWRTLGSSGHHDANIVALAWHPKLPVLATASDDLTVRFWNLDTGERLVDLPVLDSQPKEMAFSPTGKRFTVSDQETARIWNLCSADDPRPLPIMAGTEE